MQLKNWHKDGSTAKASPKKVEISNINDEKSIKPRSDLGKRILRGILWAMISFLFLRGCIAVLRPDPLAAYEKRTQTFITQQTQLQNQSLAITGFAQNFAQEYLTYAAGDKEGYNSRVTPYLALTVSLDTDIKNTATAVYVQAISLVEQSSTQYDVTVVAKVSYAQSIVGEDGAITTQNRLENVSLVVPVEVPAPGQFVVGSLPMFVALPTSPKYSVPAYEGVQVDNRVATEIKEVLTNFLKAYYEENQTRIEYYLSPTADPAKFTGLNGTCSFVRTDSVTVYQEAEQPGSFFATVKITVQEPNGQQRAQQFHINLTQSENRYYVSSMGTRLTK